MRSVRRPYPSRLVGSRLGGHHEKAWIGGERIEDDVGGPVGGTGVDHDQRVAGVEPGQRSLHPPGGTGPLVVEGDDPGGGWPGSTQPFAQAEAAHGAIQWIPRVRMALRRASVSMTPRTCRA